MLGISIYPEKQKYQDIIDYIDLAKKYGFQRIFTSLLSPPKDKNKTNQLYKKINEYALNLGFHITIDVNPKVFTQLNISYDDLSFFKELGASAIRLDLGFDGIKEANMTYNKWDLDIEINISSHNQYLENILSYQPNLNKLIGSHNFYPQQFTGLSYKFFEETSLRFKRHNIRTAAFINSQVAQIGPWELSDGLCTLEEHRFLKITTQAKHLYATNLIDDLIIGNAFASEQELKELSEIRREKLIFTIDQSPFLKDELQKKILYHDNHIRRGDTNDYSIRSTQTRVLYQDTSNPPFIAVENLKRGMIVIGNDNFGQYKNELQIILTDQPNLKSRKNLVAEIIDEEKFLLDFVTPWAKFSFKK